MSIKCDNKIDAVRKMIANLIQDIMEASEISLNSYISGNLEDFKEAQKRLNNVEAKGNMIDNEVIKTFALFGPEANELRTLIANLKMTNEIVSIGEGVKKYARRMKQHRENGCNLEPLNTSVILLHKSTLNALRYIAECLSKQSGSNIEDNYRKIMLEESKSDDLFALLENDIINIIMKERELTREYIKVLGTLRKLEQSCDRSVNIANLILYAKQGGAIQQYS